MSHQYRYCSCPLSSTVAYDNTYMYKIVKEIQFWDSYPTSDFYCTVLFQVSWIGGLLFGWGVVGCCAEIYVFWRLPSPPKRLHPNIGAKYTYCGVWHGFFHVLSIYSSSQMEGNSYTYTACHISDVLPTACRNLISTRKGWVPDLSHVVSLSLDSYTQPATFRTCYPQRAAI